MRIDGGKEWGVARDDKDEMRGVLIEGDQEGLSEEVTFEQGCEW